MRLRCESTMDKNSLANVKEKQGRTERIRRIPIKLSTAALINVIGPASAWTVGDIMAYWSTSRYTSSLNLSQQKFPHYLQGRQFLLTVMHHGC